MFREETPEFLAKKIEKKQDKKSFEKLILRWQDDVYHRSMVAELMNKQAAEELVISIFVDLWNNLVAGEYTTPLDGWMRVQADKTLVPIYRANKLRSSQEFSCVGS